MGKLQGKVALITGATTGIGRETAAVFQREGAVVIGTGASEANVARLAEQVPGVDAVRADVSRQEDLDGLMAQVRQRHGRIDVLFANAGIAGRMSPLEAVTEADFDHTIGVNLKGVFFTVQKAVPLMPDGASIILTASVAAHLGLAGSVVYAASKAGVRSMARSFASLLLPRHIRVNTLTPGLFATELFDKLGVPRDAVVAQLAQQVPMGRAGDVSEAAAAALFLASSDASFMTGSELRVSGGQTEL